MTRESIPARENMADFLGRQKRPQDRNGKDNYREKNEYLDGVKNKYCGLKTAVFSGLYPDF
jgi:hypothetical protein